MKVTIKGFVHATKLFQYNAELGRHENRVGYELYPFDMSKGGGNRVLVGEQEFTVEVPDGFDIRDGLVKNLEAEKKRLMAEFNKRVTEIDRQIQTYLAIEA